MGCAKCREAKPLKSVVLEALLVGLAGAILAFSANALSPRKLVLSRNYYPPQATNAAAPVSPAAGTNTSTQDQLQARLQAQGLQLADSNLVLQLFRDPRREQERILFVDARDQEHYEAGHIPGALLLDYYHVEAHFGEVLQACPPAEQIIVYCNGGECEDSELAAILLRDSSVPKEKLFVYGGGFAEWTNLTLPVELGQRNSGRMASPKLP